MLQTVLGAIQPHVALIALLVSSTALLISASAATIAWLNFRRKSSLNLRGFHTINFSNECDDPYVSSIVIENLKDRAVSIYAVYLRISRGYYILIENFEKSPHILRAYETWTESYEPIEHYVAHGQRIAIEALLNRGIAKHRLVVSTSEGKYVVKEPPKTWSPSTDYLRNGLTTTASAQRGMYEGKVIGGNIKYVVKLAAAEDRTQTLLIHRLDYKLQPYKGVHLTEASLKSADALRSLFQAHVATGRLSVESIEVLDLDQLRKERRTLLNDNVFEARRIGWFNYRVFGPLKTLCRRWRRRAGRSLPFSDVRRSPGG